MKKFSLIFTMVLFSLSMLIGQRTISGTITDDKGEALIGANVLVKGTTTGTITDIDGKYELKVPDGGTVVVSYTGYTDQELALGASNILDVQLVEGVMLGDVVVTALGISREKSSLGYSVQEVGSDEIKKSGTSNAIDALNGKVSGVQITNSGGQAGTGSSIVLRGYSSINGSNQPLIVVDGVPIDNSTTSSNETNASGWGTPTANRGIDINPDDIESVSVLKGGAAAALYGARAGNGALIITTKSGAKKDGGGLNVEYSYGMTFDRVNKVPELTEAFARGRNGAYSNVTHWSWGAAYASNPVFPDGTILDLNGDGERTDISGQAIPLYSDNMNAFWDDGGSRNHNFNISGGNEDGGFFASFSRFDQEGIVPQSTYDRTSFMLKGDYGLTDKLTVGGKANYVTSGGLRSNEGSYSGGLGYWHHMWDINDFAPKAPNGDHTWFSGAVPHPRWITDEEGEDYTVNRIIGNVNVSYELTPWLRAAYRVGVDNYSDTRKQVRPVSSVSANSGAGDVREIRINNRDITHNFMLNGQADLSEDFDISYVVGSELYSNEFDRIYVRGDAIVVRGLDDITNTESQAIVNEIGGKKINGIFGDVRFGYKHFLYLGLTGRNDWSSTLPLDNNSYFYPSANLGFVFSELTNLSWLYFGKLRASYAATANDAPSQSLRTTYEAEDPVKGQVIYSLGDIQANPDLKPERATELEFGLELSLFKGKIGLDAAYYTKTNVDQILEVPLSRTTGFTSSFENIGEISNQGFEVNLNLNDPVDLGDFKWGTSLNFTRNVGEIVKIADGLDRVSLADIGWPSNAEILAIEGDPFGAFYGYAYSRTDAGELIIDPATGYPIPETEKTILGNFNPDWTLGINNNFGFKGFNVNVLVEHRSGGDMVNGFRGLLVYAGKDLVTQDRYYSATDPHANATRVFPGVVENGDGTYSPNNIPAQLTNQFYQSVYINGASENLVEDASWWRLRNISIGYTLPNSLLGNSFVKGVELRLSGRNLWFKTPFKGFDPEGSTFGATNLQGIQDNAVPNTKSYGFDVKIKF